MCEKSARIVCALGASAAATHLQYSQCKCPLQRIVNMLCTARVQHKYMYILCTLSLRATFETKSADVIVKEIVRVKKFALCMKMKQAREGMETKYMSACDSRVGA